MKQQLIELMQENGLTQTQIARAIGKSPAVINQYLQGKYAGDVAAIDSLVGEFIQRSRDKRHANPLTATFIATPTARKALELLTYAHLEGEISVLYGEAGLGKSMALREYAHLNPSAILIEVDPGYTARVLLDELASRLALTTRAANLHDVSEACITKLRGSGRLLLIDEAELLPHRALESLRRIHDKTGVGIVLAGMPRLLINLKGKKGEYVQLHSRVGLALNLGSTLPRGDVEVITASVLPNLDEDVRNVLYEQSKGNARRLFKLLRGTQRTSQINKLPISQRMVIDFAKMLIN